MRAFPTLIVGLLVSVGPTTLGQDAQPPEDLEQQIEAAQARIAETEARIVELTQQREKSRDRFREKFAAAAVALARRIQAEGDEAEARRQLEIVVADYSGTKGAEDAATMLAGMKDDEGPQIVTKRWKEVFPRGKSSIKNLTDLEFEGEGDKNVIRDFKPDGRIIESDGTLRLESGRSGAIRIAQDALSCEMILDTVMGDTGNWFLLIGWDGQNGYLMESVTLRTSAVWLVAEVREGKIGTRKKHSDAHLTAGPHRVSLMIDDGAMTLKVGRALIINHIAMPNYKSGDIIAGVAPNQYGTKTLTIGRIAMRSTAVKDDEKDPPKGLPTSRILWVSNVGFFQKLHNDRWVETSSEGKVLVYDEAERVDDYVELSRQGATVRLYTDRCEVQNPKQDFMEVSKGAWTRDGGADEP